MSGYNSQNPKELKDVILRRMGAPIVNVELTEQQIYDCISRALERFGDYHYDGLNQGFKIFYVGDDEQYRHGVYDLSGEHVFAVTRILRTNLGSITSMDGNATYPWFTDFLLGMAGINGGMGTSCSKFYGPNAFGADLGYYTQLMTYMSMMQDTLSPLPDYWYTETTGQLKVTGKFVRGDIIVVECFTRNYIEPQNMMNQAGAGYAGYNSPDQWSLSQRYDNPDRNLTGLIAGQQPPTKDGAYNNRWVKDYATALAKELNGQILAKHQGMMLPGGITVDGVRLIEEARIEIERLINELDLLDPPFGILIG